MSLDLTSPLKSLEHPLQESIRELRQGYQSLSDCVEQAMAECEQRGVELADCRRQLAEARRSLIEQEKNLSAKMQAETEAQRRFTALESQLATAQQELTKAREQLMQTQADELQCRQRLEVQNEHNQQLQSRIERLESEEETSRNELAQLRAQFAPLTEATVDAARLRGELAAAQTELNNLREQVATRPDQPDLSEQLTAAEAERQQLEGELDMLRRRAAELADTLAEQKRQSAEEREQWSEELRMLRRAVDRQSELLAHRGSPNHAAKSGGRAAAGESHAAPNGNSDQVMDAVREQFEMLQRNKVRKMANVPR